MARYVDLEKQRDRGEKWEERPLLERLAIMQYVFRKLGKELDTNGEGIRYAADLDLYDEYNDPERCTRSRDLRINGQKVGTLSMSVSKEKPEHTTHEFRVIDREAARYNDDLDFSIFVNKWVEDHIGEIAEAYFRKTGEVIEGCDVVPVHHDAVPETPKGTILRLDEKKVEKAMNIDVTYHGTLPDAFAGYLSATKA